jgi:CRP-like cAMP-binding protein
MEYLFRKLAQAARLSSSEKQLLEEVIRMRRVNYTRGTEIVAQGEKPAYLHLFLDGWSARRRTFANGHRQVLGILLGGDVCGLNPDLPEVADHSIIACTDVQAARLHMVDFDKLNGHKNINAAFRWLISVDQACQREWTANVGRRSAVQRLAAFFCEVYSRQEQLGLAQGTQVPLPVNQAFLADVVALSQVHVNRVLHYLRATDVVQVGRGHLDVRDISRLQALAELEPVYRVRRSSQRVVSMEDRHL